MSNACKIETIPPEILLRIFSLAASEYNPKYEPSMGSTSSPSFWTKDLHVKLSLVQVCKTWRRLSLETLYHRIYIVRTEQLIALVNVLEDQAEYREWIHHIHGKVVFEWGWEDTYVKNIAKLLILCSSCREFSWHPLDDSYEDVVESRFSTINIFCNMSTVPSSFHSLRKLSITLDYNPAGDACYHGLSAVNFPNLEELVCEVSYCEIASSLNAITHFFTLPNLCRLTIARYNSSINTGLETFEDAESVVNLLERHGVNLSAFTLDLNCVSHPVRMSLEDLLKLDPNLTTIKIFTYALSSNNHVFASPCVSLRRMELVAHSLEERAPVTPSVTSDPCSVIGFLMTAANRSNFPSLESVVLCDASYPELPFGEAIAEIYKEASFQYLLYWIKRMREVDIALLRRDDKPVIKPEQERWGARRPPKGSETGERGAA